MEIGDGAALAVGSDLLREELAFMSARNVEDGKEGPVFRTIAVVSFLRGLIPERGVIAAEVVIGLGVIGAVIAKIAEVGDVSLVRFRDRIATTHVLRTLRHCVNTAEDGGAGDGANGALE